MKPNEIEDRPEKDDFLGAFARRDGGFQCIERLIPVLQDTAILETAFDQGLPKPIQLNSGRLVLQSCTRRGNGNIIGAMMLARTPAFVFMAKHGIGNCQVLKENLPSNPALALRAMVDVPPN